MSRILSARIKTCCGKKIQNKTYLTGKNKKNNIRLYILSSAAAISFLIVIVGILLFTPSAQQQKITYTTITTCENEKTKVDLPDGSEVWLNANSTISFSNQFNDSERFVNAEGELFSLLSMQIRILLFSLKKFQ